MKHLARKMLFTVSFLVCRILLAAQNQTVDSLRDVLKASLEDSNKVKTMNALAEAMYHENDMANALVIAQTAADLARKIAYQSGEATSYQMIAVMYQEHQQDSLSFAHLLKAIRIREAIQDKPGMAYLYYQASLYFTFAKDIAEGLKYQYKSLEISEELKDTASVGECFLVLGFFHYLLKSYAESLRYSDAALAIFDKAGDSLKIAEIYQRRAQVYREMGNYPVALNADSIAYRIYDRSGDKFSVAWILSSLGRTGEQAATLEKNPDFNVSQQSAFEAALRNYKDALRIFKETGAEENSYPVSKMYGLIGNINIKLKRFVDARLYLEKSLRLSLTTRNVETTRDAYQSLSVLDSIQGDYKQAYVNFRQHLLYRDSISNAEALTKSVMFKAQYDFDKKELIAKTEQARNEAARIRIRNILLFSTAVCFLAAIFYYLSNTQKQKAKVRIERAYADLKSTQAQLIQSEKMASLGELTAGIAHEIQNPLNFVNNFSDINTELILELQEEAKKGNIEEVTALAKEIRENETKINHHGKRADAIVKGMLQHSRSSSGVKEPTEINKLVDEYVRLAYHGLRAKEKSFNAEIITDYDQAIGKINIIPQDVGRVLLNMVNNSFYAVHEKAQQGSNGYAPKLTVRTKKIGGKIELSIADNGNGIPQKALDKIFQPFFTTKPTGQGTGLGLSLAYDIVKAHGGEINVQTKENGGAEFTILLPYTNDGV